MDVASSGLVLGRYTLLGEIASGGMATVYLGRLQGPVGFSRVVAIKRMHPHIARDADFATSFVDEATLAARIQHPNVVSTLDIVASGGDLLIVMEYIEGDALANLLRGPDRKRIRLDIPIAASLIIGALSGLHAAHEARAEDGRPLNIVHRDVSPQNILVGLDGMARIVDFGVAKAAVRSGVTRDHQLKGKICYMSPEQLCGGEVDRRADVFAAGAILWEMLAAKRLFAGDDTGVLVARVIRAEVPPLSMFRRDVPPELEQALQRALAVNPADRFAAAQDFADAVENASPRVASPRATGAWVRERAGQTVERRGEIVAELEQAAQRGQAAQGVPPNIAAAWSAVPVLPGSSPWMPSPAAMGTPQSAPGWPTPVSAPALPTPVSAPALPTPVSAPGLPTPVSAPGLPTPPAADMARFDLPDDVPIRSTGRFLVPVAAAAVLVAVGVAMWVLASGADEQTASSAAGSGAGASGSSAAVAGASGAAGNATEDPDDVAGGAAGSKSTATATGLAPTAAAPTARPKSENKSKAKGDTGSKDKPGANSYLPEMP